MSLQKFIQSAFLVSSIALVDSASLRSQDVTAVNDANDASGFLSDRVLSNSPPSLPLAWNPESVRWKCDLPGYGQSSPVVWSGKVYVTSVEGASKNRCLLTCIDLQSGTEFWRSTIDSADPVESTPMVSRAAPTPACDENGVYTFFESGDLLAVDHTGKTLWHRKLQAEYGKFDNKFGVSSSVAQTGELLFLLVDHDGQSYLLAVQKSNGETAWQALRENRGHSWTSPAIISLSGQPLVVCSSIGSVDVYDVVCGSRLVHYTELGGNSVASPIDFGQGRVLVSSLIRPADGPVEGATRSNLLAKLSRQGDLYQLEVQWIAENARGSFCSPILHGNECYWINPQGVLFCLDAETGKEHYAKRLSCGACWATPLAVGEHVYLFGREGETTVIKAGPQFEELSPGNRLWNADLTEAEQVPAGPSGPAKRTVYGVIAVDNAFLFRSGDALYRVDSN
ncbi:MAG: PQQ-binding-like beta-propeller repeat protein [Planctomycetales bacterium]|nr:PQQ-binding-like beta-propeller repeat protein [Planctomycetales bacterium]